MHEGLPEGWRCFRALYKDSAARRRLIAIHLPRLGASGKFWFFVDVPVGSGGGAREALEVAYAAPVDPAIARNTLARCLTPAAAEGLVESVIGVRRSVLLEASLHPGGSIPFCYPEASWIGSVRVAHLLGRQGLEGSERIPLSVVHAELAFTFHQLLPEATHRRAALREHAEWLEAVAGGSRAESEARVGVSAAPCGSAQTQGGPGYGGVAEQLTRHASSLGSDEDARRRIIAALVGRLAHVQVVRLLAPAGGDVTRDLLWEAAVSRQLVYDPEMS